MKIKETAIEGPKIIEPDIFQDDRGYFYESFNYKKYSEIGLNYTFVQDNVSYSKKDVIRGLHYQVGEFAQGKLVRVSTGYIIDYAVDIRFGSPTFGKFVAVELTDRNNLQLWIPPGFAHGFCIMENNTNVEYKCTSFYSKEHERGIIYNDPDIGINWPTKTPILSDKDRSFCKLKEIEKEFAYRKGNI